jgi:hypothetical protein
MRNNEFCPSLAIMVADCEKLCTKYTVDFFDRTSIGTRDLSEGREEETLSSGNGSNATDRPFAGLASAGTLQHVTGVSCIPLIEMPPFAAQPVFSKG